MVVPKYRRTRSTHWTCIEIRMVLFTVNVTETTTVLEQINYSLIAINFGRHAQGVLLLALTVRHQHWLFRCCLPLVSIPRRYPPVSNAQV